MSHLNQLENEQLIISKNICLPCNVDLNKIFLLPYRRRRGERKSSLHWGQRKLLLSEIDFINRINNNNQNDNNLFGIIIYAGSSPGSHLTLLMELFPKLL
jgi:hypothetical protein